MEEVQTTRFGHHHHTIQEYSMEKRPKYYVGIDISSADFTSSVGQVKEKWEIKIKPELFTNNDEGFDQYLDWLKKARVNQKNCVICMENTGVYGEKLVAYLTNLDFHVCVEMPLKVKRAFDVAGSKNDAVDNKQIAEYAYRFFDELRRWKTKSEILEQVKILLNTREGLVEERTGHLSRLHALKRKVVRVEFVEVTLQRHIDQLKEDIEAIEAEIERIITEVPELGKQYLNLLTAPGVGLLLSAQMVVLLNGFEQPLTDKKVAAYLGICPYEHRSGSSVRKRTKSTQHGPEVIRKLLHLGARSICTHKQPYIDYFNKKIAVGKPKYLIYNNVSNKIVGILVAMYKSGEPYVSGYRSIHPAALTKS
jgi:transposase